MTGKSLTPYQKGQAEAMPYPIRDWLSDFVSDQEPLGAEFQKVWDDNIEKLYEASS